MFNRSILSFSLGLGIPAAAIAALLAKTGYVRPSAAAGFYGALIVAAAILITLQRIPGFGSRFWLAFGAIGIANAGQWIAQEIRHQEFNPIWVVGLRMVFFALFSALLALAVAAISRPWRPSHQTFDPV